eukprot:UN06465
MIIMTYKKTITFHSKNELYDIARKRETTVMNLYKDNKFTIEHLKKVEFTAGELRAEEFTIDQLRKDNIYSLKEMKGAYSIKDLASKFTLKVMRTEGNYTAYQLKDILP